MSSPNDFSNLPMIKYHLATLNQLCNSNRSTNVTTESFNQFRSNINRYFNMCPQLADSTDPHIKETWLIWLNYVGRTYPHSSTYVHYPILQPLPNSTNIVNLVSLALPESQQRENSTNHSLERVIPQPINQQSLGQNRCIHDAFIHSKSFITSAATSNTTIATADISSKTVPKTTNSTTSTTQSTVTTFQSIPVPSAPRTSTTAQETTASGSNRIVTKKDKKQRQRRIYDPRKGRLYNHHPKPREYRIF